MRSSIHHSRNDSRGHPRHSGVGERGLQRGKIAHAYRAWEEAEVLRVYFSAHKSTCLVADRDGTVAGFALGSLLDKPGIPWKHGWLECWGSTRLASGSTSPGRLPKQPCQRFVEEEVR